MNYLGIFSLIRTRNKLKKDIKRSSIATTARYVDKDDALGNTQAMDYHDHEFWGWCRVNDGRIYACGLSLAINGVQLDEPKLYN